MARLARTVIPGIRTMSCNAATSGSRRFLNRAIMRFTANFCVTMPQQAASRYGNYGDVVDGALLS
jgi:hypothetical protein